MAAKPTLSARLNALEVRVERLEGAPTAAPGDLFGTPGLAAPEILGKPKVIASRSIGCMEADTCTHVPCRCRQAYGMR